MIVCRTYDEDNDEGTVLTGTIEHTPWQYG